VWRPGLYHGASPTPLTVPDMHPTEKAAHEILATIEATYQPSHDYVNVDPKAFRHLDLKWYDRTARLLQSKGYKPLANVEDRTITNTPGGVLLPALVRTMLSKDGTVMASLYHARIKGLFLRLLLWLLRKLPGRVVDMETECSDGSFVVTSNAASAAVMELPALISADYLRAKATVHEVHQRHVVRLAAHLAHRPGVTARVMTTQAELVASQNRMNALKAAYRGEVGGITRDELDKLSVFGASLAADVHAAVVREQVRRAS
jgi:hypothetical protein